MARKQKIPRLICYDIADERRLQRVHRIVTGYALPLQYSVYLATLDAGEVENLCAELRRHIDPGEDDIRIYPLPVGAGADWLGQPALPEGLLIRPDGGVPLVPDGGGKPPRFVENRQPQAQGAETKGEMEARS
jgi:CRISPR-associated protein Cas2